jgi:hypothetical protein
MVEPSRLWVRMLEMKVRLVIRAVHIPLLHARK